MILPVPGSRKAVPLGAAFLFAVAIVAGLAACAGTDRFGGSRQAVIDWGRERGFAANQVSLRHFRLLSLERRDPAQQPVVLHVYIEGDGAAWPSPFHPPRDPTPTEPVALAMAAADPAPAVAYLGRPCQYLDAGELASCSPDYWTGSRFAPEVVTAYMAFLDRLKGASGARRLRLIGYSGGGVIATLLAAKRSDVERLVTVAAPLAVAEWTVWHRVTPLIGSLDPAMLVDAKLPVTTHFVGARDEVVPARIVAAFAERKGGRLREVPDFDHVCCWSREWPRLLEEIK